MSITCGLVDLCNAEKSNVKTDGDVIVDRSRSVHRLTDVDQKSPSNVTKTDHANASDKTNKSVFNRLYEQTASEGVKFEIERSISQSKLSVLPKINAPRQLERSIRSSQSSVNIFDKKGAYKQLFKPASLSSKHYLENSSDFIKGKLLDEQATEPHVSLALQSPTQGFLCYRMDNLTQLTDMPYAQVYMARNIKMANGFGHRLQRSGELDLKSKRKFLQNLAKFKKIQPIYKVAEEPTLGNCDELNDPEVIST